MFSILLAHFLLQRGVLISFLKLCEKMADNYRRISKKMLLILDRLLFGLFVSMSYHFQDKVLVCISLWGISESAKKWCARDLGKYRVRISSWVSTCLWVWQNMKYMSCPSSHMESSASAGACAPQYHLWPRSQSEWATAEHPLRVSDRKWARFLTGFNLPPQSLFLFQISTAFLWLLCNSIFFSLVTWSSFSPTP